MAKAFQIGKQESDALFALATAVPEPICSELQQLVTTRGMSRFLNHDVIGKGTFSTGFSSGIGPAESWSEALTNLPGDLQLATRLVKLYLARLAGDHDNTPAPLRKAVSFKDAIKVHQSCGVFLFMMAKLQSIAPEKEFEGMRNDLLNQFKCGLLDADLLHCVDQQVPANAELLSVGAMRPFAMKIEKGKVEDRENQAKELEKQVATANLAHVKAMIAADIEILRAKLPGKSHVAAEHALDLKYLKDRKGRKYAEDFMAKNVLLIPVSEDMNTAMPAYCVAAMDMTLYPAGANYVKNAFGVLSSVTAMSPCHCGFIMLPVLQKQTTDVARIKHRRTIEDYLIKNNMSYGQEVAVLYNKPDSTSRDGRPMRGVPCAGELMQGVLTGIDVKPTDKVVWFDIIPNRLAEFARAALENLLDGAARSKVAMQYVGLVKEDKLTELRSTLESRIYDHWETCLYDNNADSPPKERPPTSTAAPTAETMGLSLVALTRGKPTFPLSVLLGRFQNDSPEQEEVKQLQKQFLEEFGEAGDPTARTTTPSRAHGVCDYTVDEGLKPLDTSRTVNLTAIPVASFTGERLGALPGRAGKPTLALDKDFHLWLVNSSNEEMEVTAGELFGFGTGSYNTQVVTREAEETNGLAWRLSSDRALVVFEKEPMALCELLRKLTVENGLADMNVEYHAMTPKMWELSSLTSQKTCIFKPNALGDGAEVKKVQSMSSPPKVMPLKPKFYLLATLKVPAVSCVDLTAAATV
ncbi:unnamed protein product [Durusdinium trenchii]|uniref:Uncharacterized protein n=1 Tax=Durusdinium trenchii TaxID=1381693 RepID=A0ABP0PKL6_9DINO